MIDEYIPGYHQRFSLRNYTIQYPYAEHERLTLHQTVWITAVCPAVIIFSYTIILDGFFLNRRKGQYLPRHTLFKVRRETRSQRRVQAQLWELNCAWLGLGLSYGLAFIIMVTLKRMGGKPRPDLIARCLPKEGSTDAEPFGLSDVGICTQTDEKKLRDGFMSWPSGHCSGWSHFHAPTTLLFSYLRPLLFSF